MKKMITWAFCGLLLLNLCSLYSNDDRVEGRSICVIIREDFRGEREFAERIKIACGALHWDAHIADLSSFKNSEKHYDWILTLVPGKKCCSKENDYLVLFDPEHHYFNEDGHLKKKYLNYAGYLATYKNTDLLLEDIHSDEHCVYPKRWYLLVQYRPYQKVNPTRLFHFIGHWGDRREDIKYQVLQNALAKKGYANFFGKPSFGNAYGDAFKGAIPYDGESVMDIISDLGVCLALHSKTHIRNGIPSGRIFEALAASAVIISDMNPFVLENFGDSVFYVDQELSGEEMFEQIDAHMVWIQNHLEEALTMAQRAHQIYEDNFLLESQLLDFDQLHGSKKSSQFIESARQMDNSMTLPSYPNHPSHLDSFF